LRVSETSGSFGIILTYCRKQVRITRTLIYGRYPKLCFAPEVKLRERKDGDDVYGTRW